MYFYKMKFSIGDEVNIPSLNIEGLITATVSDGRVLIQVGNLEIPVHTDMLEKKGAKEKHAEIAEIRNESSSAKLYGTQLIFEGKELERNNATKYDVYILNTADMVHLFHVAVIMDEQEVFFDTIQVESKSVRKWYTISVDDLNKALTFEIDVESIELHKTEQVDCKIKAKQFFGKLKSNPYFTNSVIAYTITDGKHYEAPKHDRRLPIPDVKKLKKIQAYTAFNSLQEMAEMPTDIDLHIEVLRKDYAHIPENERLLVQMKAMQKYVEKAMALGLQRVYLIHGVGKGTLRNAIHAYLQTLGNIQSYNNHFHPRYGYGATEVNF